MTAVAQAVRDLGVETITNRMRGNRGLAVEMGPFTARLRSSLPEVINAVGDLYADFALANDHGFIDFDTAVERPHGLRRWWKPQVLFEYDGQRPFNPLPGDQGFPLLEWGLNWCVYGLSHRHLTLHAAVLERHGKALILPAPSGSGKSTLCAALAFSGWRLLSDELTLIDPDDGQIVPLPRPISLKNQSIPIIQAFAPEAVLGSRVEDTAKGTVAHFRPPLEAVQRRKERAVPGWVVLPKYVAGQSATLEPIEKARALMHLAENAFNYDVFGAQGFDLLGDLVDRSPCFTFRYGHLADAVALFDRLAETSLHAG